MADARTDTPARLYAKVVGVALLLTAVVGFIAGNPEDGLFGLLNIDVVEDVIHLGTGALLAYVGFSAANGAVKTVVMGLGVIYLVVGVAGFFLPELFGLIPHEYNVADNILHLALGALALAAVAGNAAKEKTTVGA